MAAIAEKPVKIARKALKYGVAMLSTTANPIDGPRFACGAKAPPDRRLS